VAVGGDHPEPIPRRHERGAGRAVPRHALRRQVEQVRLILSLRSGTAVAIMYAVMPDPSRCASQAAANASGGAGAASHRPSTTGCIAHTRATDESPRARVPRSSQTSRVEPVVLAHSPPRSVSTPESRKPALENRRLDGGVAGGASGCLRGFLFLASRHDRQAATVVRADHVQNACFQEHERMHALGRLQRELQRDDPTE
jgi:hypothetical protein